MSTVTVVIPTYDEVENIVPLLAAVRSHGYRALVVDDASPDGTAAAAAAVAAGDAGVEVIRRPSKEGLGPAYADGFAAALGWGSDVVCQMDADFSHDPSDLPRLVAAVGAGAGLAIGSRYVPGGATVGWSRGRLLLSRWGNRYAAWMLRLPIRDATAGFRAWERSALLRADPASCAAAGYGFQVEMAWRAHRAGIGVEEVPVVFKERERGSSKMSMPIAVEAMLLVTRWGVRSRLFGEE